MEGTGGEEGGKENTYRQCVVSTAGDLCDGLEGHDAGGDREELSFPLRDTKSFRGTHPQPAIRCVSPGVDLQRGKGGGSESEGRGTLSPPGSAFGEWLETQLTKAVPEKLLLIARVGWLLKWPRPSCPQVPSPQTKQSPQ
jgi:hypothetical protein